MQPRRRYWPIQHLLMGVVTIFVLMLLAACGTNVGTTTGSAGGPITTNASTPTLGNGGTTQAPTQPSAVQNCGTVHTMRLLVVPADVNHAKGVEDCFWQAYQQCHPATMVYAQNNLDTGTIHNFSLKSVNGSCTITDGVQHFIAPRPVQGTTTATCTGLTEQADGLHFHACGESGDIVVPSVGAQ